MRKTNLTPPDDHYIARLQNAIRQLNNCESTYVESVTVSESLLSFQKNTLWEGDVAVFQIYGHPQAKRAYAWSYGSGNKHTGCVVVLEIPPVTSPRTAVQAALAGGALPQKSDYSRTFEANCISAPKINLTDWTGVHRG